MKLSDGERLILAMLCDLHKALNVKGGAANIELVRTLIADGPQSELGFARHTDRNGDPAQEVGEILEMWSAIERGYKRLSMEEREQVEVEAGPLGRGVRFSGFDDDTESKHCDIAHALIEELGRFDRFQGRNLSAPMPTLDGYRRMLRLFASMGPVSADARLNVRQIIALANAEKHPG
jgi:uncharacterized protein YfbU (UPF0304 family)